MIEGPRRVRETYTKPLFKLIEEARRVHVEAHPRSDVQTCVLLSIKTGGCPEDCSYCPQSAHYKTTIQKQALLSVDEVKEQVDRAKSRGIQRFCMGAAWRKIPEGPEFDRVLEMIKLVKASGLQSCATLGLVNSEQAKQLKKAGLDVYNHNIDTGENYYKKIIGTRTYQDRLDTLKAIHSAGIETCCGGIIGMGESFEDRLGMIETLISLNPAPESVPINILEPVSGTPLEKIPPLDPIELIRTLATLRIFLPATRLRLSAGRRHLSYETQLLAFYVGANSLFVGERLLTQPNASENVDGRLLRDVQYVS